MVCLTPDMSNFNCNYLIFMDSQVKIGDTKPDLSLEMNGKTCHVPIDPMSNTAQMMQNCDCSDPLTYDFYDEKRF